MRKYLASLQVTATGKASVMRNYMKKQVRCSKHHEGKTFKRVTRPSGGWRTELRGTGVGWQHPKCKGQCREHTQHTGGMETRRVWSVSSAGPAGPGGHWQGQFC